MAVVSNTISVAANSSSSNQLAGVPEGLLLTPAEISVTANHSGAARGDIVAHYFSGVSAKLGSTGSPVNVAATAGNIDPRTDTLLRRVAVIGQQSLVFKNTTSGALTVNWSYEIHED